MMNKTDILGSKDEFYIVFVHPFVPWLGLQYSKIYKISMNELRASYFLLSLFASIVALLYPNICATAHTIKFTRNRRLTYSTET
jgi:hypothetical protein